MLAYQYGRGLGVSRNDAEAVRLYRLAADRGYGRARAQVGLAYEAGEGVAESWTEAHAWCRMQAVRLFEHAEDQGDGQSKFFARWLRVRAGYA